MDGLAPLRSAKPDCVNLATELMRALPCKHRSAERTGLRAVDKTSSRRRRRISTAPVHSLPV